METITPLSPDERSLIKDLLREFLTQLGIQGEFVIKEEENALSLVLETEDEGMVIGYHGETLEGMQLILSLILAKKLGRFQRVSLEVGDYKKNRSEYLTRLALQTKDRVVTEQREIVLSDLKSWERRVVHMLLQDDQAVESESLGEGRDRVLVVRPRS